ncbi:hypothetical protein BUALT_Bualt11G0011200 [Buddleja alternifolia]|uniref:PB1-like domain-containing protein n=1 Tax=Buddleja alternifolia TaxID=168488 RepID=A0AAV6X2A1_9LAMI|nr:hypothetical protein BUALT_Bualt11G0011200 [Buddleja alternifolia]
MGLPLPDYADFYVWVEGNIEWIPTVRYFGGFKMVFPKVDKERFYYGDLSKMYEKSRGKCTNLTVYYCLPRQPLDSGIRKLEGDNDILDLIRAYKGENVVPIYIEESGGPLLIIGPDGNVIEPHDDMLALPPCDQTNQPIDLDEQYDADSENQFTENIDDENPDNENNVNEEIVCENTDIENPLTENSVLINDVSGIPDTENSVFENLGVENQFTENIDIENPDNENNVENPLTENIEIENPLTENMDEDFFEQLYNDENLINEAVDLNNEFEDGAWASVSDEDGQNEEGIGDVNEDGHPQEGIEASLSEGEQHDPTFQRDESESESDSSSISDCPSWMQRVEAQLEEQEVQKRVNEEGWYSDVEEENEDDLDALRGSDEEDYKYIGKRIQHFIKDNPNEGLEYLKNKIRRDVQVECSMHKVYKTKRYALELLRGDVKEQYNRLYDYYATVVKHNPNSSMVLKVDKSLTPPFDTWEWFLNLLLRDIGSHEDRGWVFLSDRQKGLVEAVAKVASRAEHIFCVRHMYNNFKATFKGVELKQIFWKAASTYNVRQHLRIISEIQRMYPKKGSKQTPYEWLNVIPAAHWARCYFPSRTKCDVLVNNITESFNSIILAARELPIIEMFEWIRKKCMTRIQIKRQGMEKYAGIVCPNILKKIEKQREIVGYPCCHVVASIASLRLDIENYVDDCFKKDTYLRVYSHMVNPVPGMHDFEESVLGIVDPPHIRILPGRPRKVRWRDGNDIRGPSVSRKGLTHTCSICGLQGHNKSGHHKHTRQSQMYSQAADEDAYMPHTDSEMSPQSATNHSTANPPPQSETGTSTELPSTSQPRRQAASQLERSQTASQPVRRCHLCIPTSEKAHSITASEKAKCITTIEKTSQGPTVGGQTSNDSTHRSSSHLPAFEVPTFGGQATTISASEGPPIPTQSQSSQNPQQMAGQSHKSRKQGNPASLSSRKLQKMKQVLSPTPNPAFKKPSSTSSVLRSISASYKPRGPTAPSASSKTTQEATTHSPNL